MADDWHAKLVWSRQKAEGQLDELVHRLGLEGSGYSALGLKLKGQRVTVRLEFEERTRLDHEDDGLIAYRTRERRLVSVFVHAKFEQRAEQQRAGTDEEEPPDSAPSIELRRETDADRADKRAGLTKEIQTGFAGFDHTVFVDNDSSEADARRILSKEATRQAVLRLLDASTGAGRGTLQRHASVRISTTGVTVQHRVQDQWVDADALLSAIEDVLIVARAGGPKDARPGRRGENAAVLLVSAAALGVIYCVWVWLAYRSSYLPLLVGGVVGAAAGFFTRPFLEERVAGDAGSGRRASQMLLAVIAASGAFCAGALAHLNVALDGGEPVVRRGLITAVKHLRSSKNSGQYIEVRFPDGTETFSLSGDVRAGQHYSERRHGGAFGFEWVDGVEVR